MTGTKNKVIIPEPKLIMIYNKLILPFLYWNFSCIQSRLEPIMLWKQPIILLSSAQKFSLHCSKLCSLMLENWLFYKSILEFPDCGIRVSDCSIRVSWSYFHKVLIISQERVNIIAFQGFLVWNAVKMCTAFLLL